MMEKILKSFASVLIITSAFILLFLPLSSFAQLYQYDEGEISDENSSSEGDTATMPGAGQESSGTRRSSIAYADSYDAAYPFTFEVNANQSDLEVLLSHTWEESERTFLTTAGIGGLYSDGEYKMGTARFALGNRTLIEGFKFDMGFKGLLGSVEKGSKDENLGAVGFLFSIAYDMPEVEFAYYGIPLDFEISAEACVATNQLCFNALDKYREIKATFGIYLLEQKKGLLFVGYRDINASFDGGSDDWKKSHDALFFGYKFRF